MSTHRNDRPLLPQEYYDSNQVMAMLKLSKERYYELIERDEDPLPMSSLRTSQTRLTYLSPHSAPITLTLHPSYCRSSFSSKMSTD